MLRKWFFFIFLSLIKTCNPLLAEVVTNPSRADGFGSQFQTIIYSIIYAELNHKTFKYTPFKSIEHNYDNDPDFIKKKEWLINLIDHFPKNEEPRLQTNADVVYIRFFESHLNQCANSQALKKIKSLFRANKERNKYFSEENFNIAVHIRRPNPHDNRVMGTNTPDAVYFEMIQYLRKKYQGQNPIFHIYSQGDLVNFKKIYQGEDLVFHINEQVEDTFTSLVLADALVTSTSSFSYTAAILSEGAVYYMPFWHPPLSHWTNIASIKKKE